VASAAFAHRVRQNFVFRIEALTPTATDGNLRTQFRERDPTRVDADQASGLARTFTVKWLSADEDVGITDFTTRDAWHTYEVRVAYPADKLPYSTLQDVMLQDRHDILLALRNADNFVGFPGTGNGSTAIGLENRVRVEDELDEGDNDEVITWTWRAVFRCNILEDEV